MGSKNRGRTRVVLADFKRKKADLGVEIEAENGETFLIPPPELWPDAALDLSDTDPLGAAREILGDRWDSWVEGGGTAGLLMAIVMEEAQASPGESSASSSS